LPTAWIDSALAGLRRVNPFIDKLKQLALSSDTEMALHLDEPANISADEVAAVISIAPASKPSRRKIVIRRVGETKHRFLDLLLLPYGTLGWSPDRRNNVGQLFSQMRWYRTQLFMNAEKMSLFSRLMGEYDVVKLCSAY